MITDSLVCSSRKLELGIVFGYLLKKKKSYVIKPNRNFFSHGRLMFVIPDFSGASVISSSTKVPSSSLLHYHWSVTLICAVQNCRLNSSCYVCTPDSMIKKKKKWRNVHILSLRRHLRSPTG